MFCFDVDGWSTRRVTRALASTLLATATPAMADQVTDGGQPVTYDRPGLAFSTGSLPLGGFVIEQGLPTWSLDNEGGVRTSQFVTDSLLRVGLGGAFEFQVGSTPFNWAYQRAVNASTLSTGRGDTVLSLKYAPPSSSQVWSWGVLGTVELPDGEGSLRLPQRQYTLGASIAQQISGANALGYFMQWQRMGIHGTYLTAISYSHALTKKWDVYMETAALHQQGDSEGLFGAGITYQPNPHLQWDISFDRRIIGSGPIWMADFGVAFYFGR